MPNRFFEEEDIRSSTDTNWRGLLAEELRRRNPFRDLHAAAVYSTPEIYLYHKDHFRPYGAKLILQMGDEGLGIGFYIERGYLWTAEAGWTLQPHWDWHHFLYLLGNAPDFMNLFLGARQAFKDFSFWIQSGESDNEEISLYASHVPFATLLGVLTTWPGHLWCDVYYSSHLPREFLLDATDEAVLDRIIHVVAAVEPVYRAVLNRKMEIDARVSNFGS